MGAAGGGPVRAKATRAWALRDASNGILVSSVARLRSNIHPDAQDCCVPVEITEVVDGQSEVEKLRARVKALEAFIRGCTETPEALTGVQRRRQAKQLLEDTK